MDLKSIELTYDATVGSEIDWSLIQILVRSSMLLFYTGLFEFLGTAFGETIPSLQLRPPKKIKNTVDLSHPQKLHTSVTPSSVKTSWCFNPAHRTGAHSRKQQTVRPFSNMK